MSSTMAWTGEWQIVTTDLDLSHVFLLNNLISFKPIGRKGAREWFKLVHSGEQPASGGFRDTFLVEVPGHQPHFLTAAKTDKLPLKVDKDKYNAAAESISVYMAKNQGVQHLEGIISMDCHAYPSQQKNSGATEHPSRSIDMPIDIYQFADAVEGKSSLLVIHTPMSPPCLVNGDGTVLAYA